MAEEFPYFVLKQDALDDNGVDCDEHVAADFEHTAADHSKSDYAYTPDDEVSHWKLPIYDKEHAAAAKAALGKGFRGEKVNIPGDALGAVKEKVNAACRKFGIPEIGKEASLNDLFRRGVDAVYDIKAHNPAGEWVDMGDTSDINLDRQYQKAHIEKTPDGWRWQAFLRDSNGEITSLADGIEPTGMDAKNAVEQWWKRGYKQFKGAAHVPGDGDEKPEGVTRKKENDICPNCGCTEFDEVCPICGYEEIPEGLDDIDSEPEDGLDESEIEVVVPEDSEDVDGNKHEHDAGIFDGFKQRHQQKVQLRAENAAKDAAAKQTVFDGLKRAGYKTYDNDWFIDAYGDNFSLGWQDNGESGNFETGATLTYDGNDIWEIAVWAVPAEREDDLAYDDTVNGIQTNNVISTMKNMFAKVQNGTKANIERLASAEHDASSWLNQRTTIQANPMANIRPQDVIGTVPSYQSWENFKDKGYGREAFGQRYEIAKDIWLELVYEPTTSIWHHSGEGAYWWPFVVDRSRKFSPEYLYAAAKGFDSEARAYSVLMTPGNIPWDEIVSNRMA